VTLEVFDATKNLVRRYSSDDKAEPIDPLLTAPTYWVRPPAILPSDVGMHRFVWDLHYPPPDALRHEYPISAIYRDTPRYPLGAVVTPGQYTVKLTAGGKSYTQPLTVKMDPRIKTPPAGLLEQFRLATRLTSMLHRDYQVLQEVRELRTRLKSENPELEQQAAAIEGGAQGSEGLSRLNGEMVTALDIVEGADATPTTQMVAAVADLQRKLDALIARLRKLNAVKK
jgi:hypothetical protein